MESKYLSAAVGFAAWAGTVIAGSPIEIGDSDVEWLGVAAGDWRHEGGPGRAVLAMTVDGTPVGEDTSEVATSSPGVLTGLSLRVPFAAGTPPGRIGISLRWNGEEVARAIAERAVGDVLALHLVEAAVDPGAPLRLSGPTAFTFTDVWFDEVLTVAFAWDGDAGGDVQVRLRAIVSGAEIERTSLAVPGPKNSWSASFALARARGDLTWNATILQAGVARGITGSRVDFQFMRATDGFFRPVEGSGLVTAGGFHDVKRHEERVVILSAAFGPTYAGEADCAPDGVYDTLYGQTWRIAHHATSGTACGDALPATTVATPPAPIEYPEPSVLPPTPPSLPPTATTSGVTSSQADVAPPAPSAAEAAGPGFPGGLAGGLIAAAAVGFLIVFLVKRRRRKP